MNKIKNDGKGFTLLELLVVVLIIGILAVIAVPQYRKAVAKAELAQIISVTKTLKQAQDRFYLTNGTYADNINKLDISVENSNVTCSSNVSYIQCYNKNFVLWEMLDSQYLECASKTEDENSALFHACKDFMQNNFKGSIKNLCSTCSTCQLLNKNPCYKWSTNYSTF